MKIAFASGKGGTGKTTLAVNVALAAKTPLRLLDCDVEAPNAHLFLKGDLVNRRIVTVPVPVIDEARCDGCGECSRFCAFNAIVSFGTVPAISQDMCHGCGGCMRVCPQKAIREIEKRIGIVETMRCGAVTLAYGVLDVGVAIAPPLIRAVKEEAEGELVLIDAPPGTSCPVSRGVRETDYVVLVTEPTPFGLNDLRLAVDVVRELGTVRRRRQSRSGMILSVPISTRKISRCWRKFRTTGGLRKFTQRASPSSRLCLNMKSFLPLCCIGFVRRHEGNRRH